MVDFGMLKKVDLREAWMNEAQHFTPWVAENLELLGDAIDISLTLEQTEKAIGSFSADILATDTLTSRPVLIENQIERTDHSHLGQTITYAAGINASAVVWIASQFREEHRAALDWLNEHTDADLAFFGIEVEVWRIGNSAMAPKFNVVCRPNEWARTVHGGVVNHSELSETRQAQLEFWTQYVELIKQKPSDLRTANPTPYSWLAHAVGRSGATINSVWSTYNSITNTLSGEVRVELVLSTAEAKSNFARLESLRPEIESQLRSAGIEGEIAWYNPDDAQVCRIYVRNDANVTDRDAWVQQQQWLLSHAEIFYSVLGPIVRNL